MILVLFEWCCIGILWVRMSLFVKCWFSVMIWLLVVLMCSCSMLLIWLSVLRLFLIGMKCGFVYLNLLVVCLSVCWLNLVLFMCWFWMLWFVIVVRWLNGWLNWLKLLCWLKLLIGWWLFLWCCWMVLWLKCGCLMILWWFSVYGKLCMCCLNRWCMCWFCLLKVLVVWCNVMLCVVVL